MSAWLSFLMCAALAANPVDGNRLAYLDGHDIYYPHTKFPKLITPQWVGEDGVDAVVILAIDDMRDTAKYETYLRPILQRLKQIDGRAPVSIMTCAVKPDDPQLQTWLQEGLSLEVHTFDHPCPLLPGDLAKAKGTYDKCVDLMFSIPNNTPVAYRMPCCDSLNTVSPRFYKEIFSKTTDSKRFLQVSSSVFQVYTADDPEIPRELLFDADGKDRFRKYFPKGLKRGETTHDRFLNYVENYPYPYVIDRLCWEFPCMTPSDWEANFLHQPNNPQTVADMKAALDITVLKQGVLNLVFHPHGWIQAEQINDLINHTVTKHGKKVKFLTFKEALERLNKNLDRYSEARAEFARNAARNSSFVPESRSSQNFDLIDLNADGYLDIHSNHGARTHDWLWLPTKRQWEKHQPDGGKSKDPEFLTTINGTPANFWFFIRNDIDGDGISDQYNNTVFGPDTITFGGSQKKAAFPKRYRWEDGKSIRLIDINEDGNLDFVKSDSETYGVWLFESREKGWSNEILFGWRGKKPADQELPPIVRADGTDNGFFVRDRGLHWINEDTAHLPNLAVSWDFDKLLGDRMPAAKTPRAAVESMRVRPGFTVELMAHEPMVMDPVAFQWGPDGKLWVAEMADYPNGMDGRGEPGGRIRFLEDTNSDGEYDKSTLFLEKVPFPNGVHPWKNGVLISAAPDILFAADTDGDGKADVREVLYTGFAEGNQQHRVNGFTWGLDGWLYLANGDSGGQIESKRTGKKLDIRGRDLRIHPETGDMEAIEGQTQFGRARDDWGHWFGNNNSRPLWHYVLEDRYLSRNPHLAPPDTRRDVSNQPGNAPVYPASRTLTRFNDFHTANRFTSACGAIVTSEIAVGSSVKSQVSSARKEDDASPQASAPSPLRHLPLDTPHLTSFVSEPVHNLVHCELMEPDGVTFRSRRLDDEQQSEFLASTDNWFRPTQLRVGPDGALWIADMYRLVIEHPQWIPQEWQEKLNVRAGDDKGRLWRVAPIGNKPKPPRLDKLSDVELVAAMDSPNRWQRDTAQQLLIERLGLNSRKEEQNHECLRELISLMEKSKYPETRLQALSTLETLGVPVYAHMATRLQDPHPAVRAYAIRILGAKPASHAVLERALNKLSSDPSPWVQIQLAATLGKLSSESATRALIQLLQAMNDPMVQTMALSSLSKKKLPSVAPAAIMAFHQDKITERVLGEITTMAVAFQEPVSLKQLSELLLVPPPRMTQNWQWIVIEKALAAGKRSGRTWEEWFDTKSMIESPTTRLWDQWLDQVAEVVVNPEVDVEQRIRALRVLRYHPRIGELPVEPFRKLLSPQQPPAIQRGAIELASAIPSSNWGNEIISQWRQMPPTLRGTVRENLLSQAKVAQTLLSKVADGTLTPADIDPETEQFLRSHRDGKIRQEADRVLKRADTANRNEVVANYLRTMPESGDAAAGKELFAKRCAQCHKLGETGHAVGPDLASLTDKSVAAITTAVLDPNRAVESKFLQFNAVTNSGQTVAGLISAESATSITLLAAEAKATTLLRNEIDELVAVNKSLMPEGLEKELSPAALADLVTFIRGNVPLPARKTFAGNEPKRVTADEKGAFVLTPGTSEIYGPTIVLEEKHGNLGWWSSSEDFVVWTVDVPKPGAYTVAIEWACDRSAQGHQLLVQGGRTTLAHRVKATAGWDDYQREEIGTIELEAGPRRLTLRPSARPLPALMDLKSVKLTPQ